MWLVVLFVFFGAYQALLRLFRKSFVDFFFGLSRRNGGFLRLFSALLREPFESCFIIERLLKSKGSEVIDDFGLLIGF